VSGLLIIRVVRPLRAMTEAMQNLAKGNVDVTVPALDRNDEIGQMAKDGCRFSRLGRREEPP